MKIKKYIPNGLTLLNLFSGLLALIAIFNGFYDQAFLFVCLGIFFDFWDGFFARKFGVFGDLGKQLDSLADMVTSGVVPGLMMFKMLENIQRNQVAYAITEDTFYMSAVPYFGFLITLASCYRLAKFNIDVRQTNSFIGLPTPANALLIMSIPMIQYSEQFPLILDLINNPYVLVFITLLSMYLLNAEIPLFALKFKSYAWKDAKIQYLFIIFSILMVTLLSFIGIPIIIISYILISLIIAKIDQRNSLKLHS